jgi:hypothetical protein
MFGLRRPAVKVTRVTMSNTGRPAPIPRHTDCSSVIDHHVHSARDYVGVMSNQPTGTPRDVVEGGPERPLNGQDEPEEHPTKRGDAAIEPERTHPLDAPSHHSDDPWYQPESGQLGPD